jgi:serine protease Do
MGLTPFAALSANPIGDDLADVARRLRDVTVRVQAGGAGEGAGVLWREGLVLTNAHVARSRVLGVRLPNGRSLEAELMVRDPSLDLAALSIPGADHTFAELGESSSLRPGSIVVAFGHPLGVSNALSLGVVHHVALDDAGEPRWIRIDLRLAPGNSGGPLADAFGRVIGINTLVAGGLGHAIPLRVISRFLEQTTLSTPGRGRGRGRRAA